MKLPRFQLINMINRSVPQKLPINSVVFTIVLLMGVSVIAQRKEIRKAESALYNEDYYIAKKWLERAEPEIENERRGLKGRYYLAQGDTYLGLNGGDYGNIEGLETAEANYNKAIEYGKKQEGKEGVKVIEETLVKKAIVDRDNQNYESAYEKMLVAYKLNPKDTLYLYTAGQSAYQAGIDEEAIKTLEELRTKGFKGSTEYYTAVQKESGIKETFPTKQERDLYVESGHYENPANEKTPSKEGEIIKQLVLLYIENGQEKKGWEIIETAKTENPENAEIIKAEALVYRELSENEKFIMLMKNLINQNPEGAGEYNALLGDYAIQEGEYDNAREYYKKAIETNPEMSGVYKNLARLNLINQKKIVGEMRKLKESKEDLDRYKKLQEKWINTLEKAASHLEKAYKFEPRNLELVQSLYQINASLNNKDATEKYKKILEENN